MDTGRQVDDHCFTVDVPNQPLDINATDGVTTTWNGFVTNGGGFCHVVTSWANNTDFRFRGSIPIKAGFTGSFIFRNTPGAVENATLTVTAAAIAFKNGRPPSTFTNPQVVNLITPNSIFGPRFNQLDLSLNKMVNVGWGRLRLAFDLYNALNSSVVLTYNNAFIPGGNWLQPNTILTPRMARISAEFTF